MLNRRITRPIDGVDYENLKSKSLEQAKNAVWKLRAYEGKATELLLQINGLLDDFSFAPENANQFEAAMQDLALYLGFLSHRPENDFGSGPDVLWAVGNLEYFVIECKSSATNPTISKHYANQLSGSMHWFYKRYDQTSKAIAILVHPSRKFEDAATPDPSTRVITAQTLPHFKEAIRAFIRASATSLSTLDSTHVQKLLEQHNLTPSKIVQTFTESPK